MSLISLSPLAVSDPEKGLKTAYDRFVEVLSAIENKDLKPETIDEINKNTALVNEVEDSKKLKSQLQKKRYNILQVLEKKEKLVAKNHYRNLWMALGMVIFGLPIGMAIAGGAGNMGMFAIGLPIGIPFGMAVGTQKDKKAAEEGRQLAIEA
ncbi:hypothetical protein O3Q51_06055 [Cryomorphaceae bacterium 1068]|nr:hypothetical protein [Cryomorphaceae bacterium 1068]